MVTLRVALTEGNCTLPAYTVPSVETNPVPLPAQTNPIYQLRPPNQSQPPPPPPSPPLPPPGPPPPPPPPNPYHMFSNRHPNGHNNHYPNAHSSTAPITGPYIGPYSGPPSSKSEPPPPSSQQGQESNYVPAQSNGSENDIDTGSNTDSTSQLIWKMFGYDEGDSSKRSTSLSSNNTEMDQQLMENQIGMTNTNAIGGQPTSHGTRINVPLFEEMVNNDSTGDASTSVSSPTEMLQSKAEEQMKPTQQPNNLGEESVVNQLRSAKEVDVSIMPNGESRTPRKRK